MTLLNISQELSFCNDYEHMVQPKNAPKDCAQQPFTNWRIRANQWHSSSLKQNKHRQSGYYLSNMFKSFWLNFCGSTYLYRSSNKYTMRGEKQGSCSGPNSSIKNNTPIPCTQTPVSRLISKPKVLPQKLRELNGVSKL